MKNATTLSGSKRSCIYSAILGAFFLISLVATGLLVYHFAPCREKKVQPDTGSGGGRGLPTIPPEKKNIRLPKAVVPDLYELWLIPFIWEGNFTFHGEVII